MNETLLLNDVCECSYLIHKNCIILFKIISRQLHKSSLNVNHTYFTSRYHNQKKHVIYIKITYIFFVPFLHFEACEFCTNISIYDFHMILLKFRDIKSLYCNHFIGQHYLYEILLNSFMWMTPIFFKNKNPIFSILEKIFKKKL